MPYVFLKSCFADGGRRNAGDILNLGSDEARSLTAMGRVEYVDAPSPKKEVNDRSVALKNSKVAKPKTRKGKK